MTSDDYGFPVKLGQDVSRHHGRWMWRIEVREPYTMVAAWFTHDNLWEWPSPQCYEQLGWSN